MASQKRSCVQITLSRKLVKWLCCLTADKKKKKNKKERKPNYNKYTNENIDSW